VSADQLKDRKSVLVAGSGFLFILFHLFRLLMQSRRLHTYQQRELGPRLRSAFLNLSVSAARHSYGQPIYRLHLGFTTDRVAIGNRGVAVAAHEKERSRQPRQPLHLCPLEFFELILQFIKRLFCMLIQMAADLQFHFGSLRIGLPLGVPNPIFRCLNDIGVNLRQV
jgi:hypothetical protein